MIRIAIVVLSTTIAIILLFPFIYEISKSYETDFVGENSAKILLALFASSLFWLFASPLTITDIVLSVLLLKNKQNKKDRLIGICGLVSCTCPILALIPFFALGGLVQWLS